MKQDCIFCKIIANQIPCKKIKETEDLIVIQDIAPQASIHYLIIPKKHIADISQAQDLDQNLLGSLLLMAKELSLTIPGAHQFQLISNNGASVGQSVFHIHMHFLAGKKIGVVKEKS